MRYQCDAAPLPERGRANPTPADSSRSTRARDSKVNMIPINHNNHEYRYLARATNTRYLLLSTTNQLHWPIRQTLQVHHARYNKKIGNFFYKIKHNHIQTYTHYNIQSCSSRGTSMTLLETWRSRPPPRTSAKCVANSDQVQHHVTQDNTWPLRCAPLPPCCDFSHTRVADAPGRFPRNSHTRPLDCMLPFRCAALIAYTSFPIYFTHQALWATHRTSSNEHMRFSTEPCWARWTQRNHGNFGNFHWTEIRSSHAGQ